jgi:hypothetical protein
MHYKTIALELIQDRPGLYERLRMTKRLLPSMEAYAEDLKSLHDGWKETLLKSRPHADPYRIAAEALEMAIQDLQDRLPCELPTDEADHLSLADAIRFVRTHTPPA